MEEPLSLFYLYVLPWAGRIVIALLILVAGKILARSLAGLAQRMLLRYGLDDVLVKFLGTMVHTLLLIAVVLASIDSLGISITSLLAIVGAAGLAIGLALKDSLSNLAAGIMLIIFRPFRTGDFITAGGSSGVVNEIGLFTTMMNTPDNQRIIVPNSAIISSTIVNANALPTRRIDLVFNISYGDDIAKAKSVMSTVLSADGRILPEPEPAIAVAALSESSVDIYVRPWVATADYWAVRGELLERIKVALEEAGMTIPFPQQEVHMRTVNPVNPADES